ncbi:MAG TPA: META domain-containing protein [Acidobacteriota bacterium]|nr:META domain-containing protein [Acidobacteriota bacterium]
MVKKCVVIQVLSLIFLSIIVVTTLVAEENQPAKRLQFEKGKNETTVQGKIQGYDTAEYLIQAGAAQTIDVTLQTKHSATYFNVFAPGAQPGRDAALFAGEIGGQHFQGKLTIAGDYLVQIYMMRSAARRKETAQFTLNIRIEGTADFSAKSPEVGPWPIDTDASGDLPCSTDGKNLNLQCPFRVKRNTYGATIWTIKPGETRDLKQLKFEDLRVLYFEKMDNKENFSVKGSSKVSWERAEDNWIVTVADHECYKIPDTVIHGGFAVAEQPKVKQLQGSTWEWVKLVDPVETIDIAKPGDYTITFSADGSAAIKADCNRAGANYKADETGSIKVEVGPMTKAACPPESKSDQFVKKLNYVATYFFKDGHLFIDMMADGGTFEFRPAAASSD